MCSNKQYWNDSDKSRYGTLVNREELKGAETHLKEGDLLQFGHKSNFRFIEAFSCTEASYSDATCHCELMMQG